MDKHPIGVIDSGSGGLSIWQSIVTLLPHESTIYIGDHAYIPYSDKTRSFIRSRIVTLIKQLKKYNCKLCVIACNTATVAGIDWYRKQFPHLPIVGVVPVIKTAASMTKTNTILILSTKFTAKSRYLSDLIQAVAPDKKVFSIGSSSLVTLIESPKNNNEEIQKELQKMLALYKKFPIDVIVLGCTHFPFIKSYIRDAYNRSMPIIDSGDAVARQVSHILHSENLESAQKKPPYLFLTTGDVTQVLPSMERLLNRQVVVERLSIS